MVFESRLKGSHLGCIAFTG